MHILKIWYGKTIPGAIISRLNQESLKMPPTSKMTLVINSEVCRFLVENPNLLSETIEVINIETFLNSANLQERFLLKTINQLIAIGFKTGSTIPYGIASDLTRWLPCVLKNSLSQQPKYKVYTDTDIIISRDFFELNKEVTEPILIQMKGVSNLVAALDCGFIQLPDNSKLPLLITSAYFQIFSKIASPTLLESLVSSPSCGGILLLRASNLLAESCPYLHAADLSKEQLASYNASEIYDRLIIDLHERSWLLSEKTQLQSYEAQQSGIDEVLSIFSESDRTPSASLQAPSPVHQVIHANDTDEQPLKSANQTSILQAKPPSRSKKPSSLIFFKPMEHYPPHLKPLFECSSPVTPKSGDPLISFQA